MNTPASRAQSWQPGARVGDYTLVEQIGAGGMGAVYLAEHQATGVRYAIKTLLVGAGAESILRFQREAEAQARVDAHPNVVRVHSAGIAHGQAYLVMDLATGGDLAARLKTSPPSAEEGAALVAALARGLHSAHQHGVLHRDLKPANVMFDERGTPKLVDFGLASVSGQSHGLTKTGDVLGTPAYMAPEQASGDVRAIDVRTDVYGLGATLYEVLSGRPPFVGSSVVKTLMDVMDSAPAPPSVERDVPRAIENVCLRALSKRPADRQQSALEFAVELEAAIRGVSPGSGARVGSGLVAAALGLAVTIGVGAWAVANDGDAETQPSNAATSNTGNSKPADAKPADAKPADAKPADSKPADSKPPETTPPSNPEWCRFGSAAQLPTFELEIDDATLRGPWQDESAQLVALRVRALAGDVTGMTGLAAAVERETRVPEHKEKALAWYLRAREAGSWAGTFGAANLLTDDTDLRSPNHGVRLWVEATRDPELPAKHLCVARFEIGEALRRGDGAFVADPTQAIAWLAAACSYGGVRGRAKVSLATLLIRRGNPEDQARARALLEESQSDRDAGGLAMTRLAELALGDQRKPRDEEQAHSLLLRAATGRRRDDGRWTRRPSKLAMLRLGKLLRDRGDPQSVKEAISWFEKATEAGREHWFRDDGHFAIFRILDTPEFGIEDRRRANKHLAWAARLGHTEARRIQRERAASAPAADRDER